MSGEIKKTGDQLKCLVCDKQILSDEHFLHDAAFIVLNAGFGSRHDMDTGEAVICDDCVERKRSYFEGYRNRIDSFTPGRKSRRWLRNMSEERNV